jgi:hypothetical protein
MLFLLLFILKVQGLTCRNYSVCTEGCELIRMWMNTLPGHFDCVNITHSKPIFIPISLPYDMFVNNRIPEDNLILATTHYAHTLNGSFCPYGCILNNNICEGISLPSGRQIICEYTYTDTCSQCNYNAVLNECISINRECTYVNSLDRAVLCPIGCSYNLYTNRCIPSGIEGNTYPICKQLTHPVCKQGCKYNISEKQCKTIHNNSNKYSSCESLILARCDYPYFIPLHERYAMNITQLTSCNNNITDICYDNQQGIIFPERLKFQYTNIIKCTYSNIHCNEKGCSTGTCPLIKACCGS